MRTPTPWERLDGMKHGLDSILEQAVQWEQERIIKIIEDSVGSMTAEVIIKLISEAKE